MHLSAKRRQATARWRRSTGLPRAAAMMMAASSGVAVRRLVASLRAAQRAAGVAIISAVRVFASWQDGDLQSFPLDEYPLEIDPRLDWQAYSCRNS